MVIQTRFDENKGIWVLAISESGRRFVPVIMSTSMHRIGAYFHSVTKAYVKSIH